MFIRNHLFYFVSSLFFVVVVVFHFIPLGIVRVEQKNNTFFDMNIFEDGPYEVGGETDHDESLVPVPANSYLGRNKQRYHTSSLRHCLTLSLWGPTGWEQAWWEPGPSGHALALPWWKQIACSLIPLAWASAKSGRTCYHPEVIPFGRELCHLSWWQPV